MGNDVQWNAGVAGRPGVVQSEERGPRNQAGAAQPGEQRDSTVGADQAGVAGEVAGEVARAVTVLKVAFVDAAAAVGVDLAVGGFPIRRRGQDQRHRSGRIRRGDRGQPAGVSGDDADRSRGALAGGESGVGTGNRGPAGFIFHADGMTGEVRGFHTAGPNATHRIKNQIAGPGERRDDVTGERGQHFRRMGGGRRTVPVGALATGVLLTGRPHRQRPDRLPRVRHGGHRMW